MHPEDAFGNGGPPEPSLSPGSEAGAGFFPQPFHRAEGAMLEMDPQGIL